MKHFFLLMLLLLIGGIALLPAVHAHCPLCSAAVGAGAVTASYYGFDMSISGLFVGAFAISTGIWVARKIKKSYIPFQSWLIVSGSFLLTVVPLRSLSAESVYLPILLFGDAGTMLNRVYWLDKILFGASIGAVITIIGVKIHESIKASRGRVFFPFQGIAITLGLLLICGLGLYLII